MSVKDRGFGSMDKKRVIEIARMGGLRAHDKGTAHEWTSEEAREAGRKGGAAAHKNRPTAAPKTEKAVPAAADTPTV